MQRLLASLKTVKITTTLLILTAFPLFVAITFATLIFVDRFAEARMVGRVKMIIDPVVLISDLVHEQQIERGMTAIFLGSNGEKYSQELVLQRIETDEKYNRIQNYLAEHDLAAIDAKIGENLDDIMAQLSLRDEIRTQVDGLDIGKKDAIQYYTRLNTKALEIVNNAASLGHNIELSQNANSFYNFLALKEMAGLERAVGAAAFDAGQFTPKGLEQFSTLIAQQKYYSRLFYSLATKQQQQQYDEITASQPAQDVVALRKEALAARDPSISGRHLKASSSGAFFEAQTQKINQLKDLEQVLGQHMLQTVDRQLGAITQTVTYIIIAILAAFVLLVALTAVFIKAIKSGFHDLVKAAEGLAQGDLEAELPEVSENELGRITAALEVFRGNIRDGRAAEKVMQDKEAKHLEEKARLEREERAAHLEMEKTQAEERAAVRDKEQKAAAEIASVVAACARGDFTRRLETSNKEGAFAEICIGVNQIGDVTNSGLDQIKIALQAMERGDLTYRLDGEFQGVFDEIKCSVNQTVESLSLSIQKINSSSETIGASTSEIASASTSLAKRTEHSAATLEETSASIKSLSVSVKQTAQLALDTNTQAVDIQEKVKLGTEVVSNTIEAIRGIEESSKTISNTISLIDEITFQTNLLALNAGVEAARAGEAGRGFAVVASEVRELAARSSEAANKISSLIAESEARVKRGVGLADQTGESLKSISTSVSEIVSKIDEISESANGQSVSITEINVATDELDKVTQQNAAMFEETSASSTALNFETDNLAEVIATFKTAETSYVLDAEPNIAGQNPQ